METFEVRARESALRCAVCRDGGSLLECPRCRSCFHEECVTKCPTLGCGHKVRRGRVGAIARLVAGAAIPLVALVENEALHGSVSISQDGFFAAASESRGGPFWFPFVQRPLYPLVAWSIAALLGAELGVHASWARVGVWGGAIVSLAFSLVHVELGVPAIVPLASLVAFIGSARRIQREERSRALRPLVAAWLVLAVLGGSLVEMRARSLGRFLDGQAERAEEAGRGVPRRIMDQLRQE